MKGLMGKPVEWQGCRRQKGEVWAYSLQQGFLRKRKARWGCVFGAEQFWQALQTTGVVLRA